MQRLAPALRNININIHPIAKARIKAACERRHLADGSEWTMTRYFNEIGWNLPALPPDEEKELRILAENLAAEDEQNGHAPVSRTPRHKKKRTGLIS